jgi:hypothetical protein
VNRQNADFLKAAGSGDHETVAALIAQGIDPNLHEEQGLAERR